MIIGAPITAVGGTIRRLDLWLSHAPDGNEILFLYHSSTRVEKLFPRVDGFAHVRLKGSGFLGRWGRVLVFPAVAWIGWNAVKHKPSVALSFFPWTMLATGLVTRIARRCGLKVRHVIHVAGDPIPPVDAVWRKWFYRALFGLNLRICEEVVVLSEGMANTLRSDYKVPRRVRVKVVPISIERSTIEVGEAKRHEGNNEVTFGIVSRLQPEKACEIGLRAFAAVAQKVPVRLLIYGTGPEEPQLKELAVELGVAERVEFLGWIDNPRDAFEVIDCVLLPSKSEGTPRSLLEAASMGVPMIASSVGGIPDLIEHGRTGWLMPPGDVDTLTQIMFGIINQPKVLSEVGARARAAVETRPSPADEIREILGAV